MKKTQKENIPVRTVRQNSRTHSHKKIKKAWSITKLTFATIIAAAFAIMFLMPIVLTITNSFMAASEISANYGSVFATTDTGGKVYISEKVNLKFIPDMVSFSQYITVLFKSPEYLLKFWNSVVLVVPIVVFQLVVASVRYLLGDMAAGNFFTLCGVPSDKIYEENSHIGHGGCTDRWCGRVADIQTYLLALV